MLKCLKDEKAEPTSHSFSGTKIRGGHVGPYSGYVHALSELTRQFRKPVLLIHGDQHKFMLDRPLVIKPDEILPDGIRYDNLMRLQVYGSPESKAVRVTVNTDSTSVFGFSPLH